jgi:hypothetical protein
METKEKEGNMAKVGTREVKVVIKGILQRGAEKRRNNRNDSKARFGHTPFSQITRWNPFANHPESE